MSIGSESNVPDYTVGYFGEQGIEVGYDELSDANQDSVTFGVQPYPLAIRLAIC
ncbi:hypothetical protein B0G52_107108 [Cohnella sp. SGD-V74]|jgi:hypothetical protein|nr:hypothetical protein B0G52_107108 [Cohnella sp. SGD-V74]